MAQPWPAFWRAMTRFDRGKVVPEIAIRNTIGFAMAFSIAGLLASPNAGVLAGIGALNVSYSDSRDPYIIRTRRMLLSSLLCGFAVTFGALSGHSNGMAILAATLWAFAAGMLVALGTTAGDLGVITLVTIVVFAARPLAPLEAVEAGMLGLGGGFLQTLLAIALWPIRPYEPERRIVGSLYRALAEMARAPGLPSSAPQLSNQISDAQDALTSLNRDHRIEAERLVFLLHQAERIRLSILTLGRLVRRIRRDDNGREASELLSAVPQAAAVVLESIARTVQEGAKSEEVKEFTNAAGAFQKFDQTAARSPSAFFAALIRDARQQTDALGGQLRAAAGLVSQPLSRVDTEQPWKLRLSGRLAQLQANMSLHSTVFRHAVRLAVCLGIGDALGRSLSLQRTYWIPMTIAIVLKPDFTATVSRGVLRIAGTFAGLILATALFHFVHTGVLTDILLMTAFTFLLRWIGPANYGVFVTALSAMIVLLIATTGVAPKEVITARAENTAFGGILAMIAYALWPTWERTQVGPALADMIELYRVYFRTVIEAYEGGPISAIDGVRTKGRRARSNAEASLERMSAEPGITDRELNTLNAILVNSHSFVHAVMAMEAGLYHTRTVPARPATLAFAARVDRTLVALADSLRNRRPLPKRLPDLRAAHNAIVEGQGALSDRHALVNVETDRITTSLNTLCEQITVWVTSKPNTPVTA